MDLLMPGMNGAEATRQIMKRSPCPILVVTATVAGNYSLVCEALGYGAFDAVSTPVLGNSPARSGRRVALGETGPRGQDSLANRCPGGGSAPAAARPPNHPQGKIPNCRLIAIGASTGGPNALQAILSKWPKDFPRLFLLPSIFSADFADSLAAWLSNNCQLTVRMARDGDRPQAGVVLVAGTDDHLVMRSGWHTRIHRRNRSTIPSAHRLTCCLRVSPPLAPAFGRGAVDRDRPRRRQGTLDLRRAGWHTIAQDQHTSVVYGMPQAASRLNAAVDVLPVGEIGIAIAARVQNLVQHNTVT